MSELTVPPAESKEKESLKRPQRKPRGKVIIFANWCKGCRLCVEFCPTGVLAIGPDDLAYVAHAENCTACHWCDTHCPDLAIIVEPIEE
ncbi:MAG: 4Fe-4S binding protein [Anaerolineales bacterium]